jgi:hypothetical protein
MEVSLFCLSHATEAGTQNSKHPPTRKRCGKAGGIRNSKQSQKFKSQNSKPKHGKETLSGLLQYRAKDIHQFFPPDHTVSLILVHSNFPILNLFRSFGFRAIRICPSSSPLVRKLVNPRIRRVSHEVSWDRRSRSWSSRPRLDRPSCSRSRKCLRAHESLRQWWSPGFP